MQRELINYLPLYLHQVFEIREIMGAEQYDIDAFWDALESVAKNQFILSCTIEGVERWENMLGIMPKHTATLDERKFKILSMMNFSLPYTYRKLQEILISVCGENNFKTALYSNDYRLIVKLAIESEENYEAVKTLLRNICPANLITDVFVFNVHKLFGNYRHGDLRKYTHSELRTEII